MELEYGIVGISGLSFEEICLGGIDMNLQTILNNSAHGIGI